MLVYEDLKDFVERFKQAVDKQIYVNENRMIAKEGILSGEVLLQFHDEDMWHILRYKEDIPSVELIPESIFMLIGRVLGVEESKKMLDKYNASLVMFDEKIKKAVDDSVNVFKQLGAVHTNIIHVSG